MHVVHNPENTEYYKDVKEFLAEDARIELDIQIIGLKGKMRIAALTFAQMEKINKRSMIDGKLDGMQFAFNTILEGMVRPRFNSENVQDLADYSGEVVRTLSDQIWQLGRLTKTTFEAYLSATEETDEKKKVEGEKIPLEKNAG